LHIVLVFNIKGRSVVFVGQMSVNNSLLAFNVKGVWAAVYLDKKLILPSKKEQENARSNFGKVFNMELE